MTMSSNTISKGITSNNARVFDATNSPINELGTDANISSVEKEKGVNISHTDGNVKTDDNEKSFVVVDYNMETTETKIVKKKQTRFVKPAAPAYKTHLTTLSHFCVAAYALLIVRLCLTSSPFVFFTWHPLLLSVGWMLLMTEGVLFISKENKLVYKLKLGRDMKLRYHWVAITAAAVLIITGFAIVTINKNNLNKNHYTSWHGLLGLIGCIATVPALINGVPALYSVNLKKYVKPKLLHIIHIGSGCVSLIFGGLSLILSVYTKWFAKNTNHNSYIFYLSVILVTFPVIWSIHRPMNKCIYTLEQVVSKLRSKE